MSEEIIVTHSGAIATLTLNRPERHNAFDDELIGALTERLRALDSDPDVHAVVLAGSGASFSAGADLHWMRRMAGYTPEENRRDAVALATLMQTLNDLRQPTIARVHGAALGGGVGLVACCDIAIAADSARFAFSEVRLGLIPAAISPYVVKAIGERQARRYMVTGERFDAVEARRIGLVHEVVTDADLDSRIAALLDRLRQNGPEAMVAAKALVPLAGGAVDTTVVDETARRIADIRAGAEAREGITAFLDKRKPGWTEG